MKEQSFNWRGVDYFVTEENDWHIFGDYSGIILKIDPEGNVFDKYQRKICIIDYNSKGHFAVFENNPKGKDLVNFSTYDHTRLGSEIKLLRYIVYYNILEYYRGKEKR